MKKRGRGVREQLNNDIIQNHQKITESEVIFLMIRRSYQQYAIVTADSAQRLTEELNATLVRLRDKNPTVTFEGMIARIQYTEQETVPESLEDEYALLGVKLTCEDCPFFTPALKLDGTEDLRSKMGGCPFNESKRTDRRRMACERLYEMLNDGRIKLCVTE